MKIEGVIVATVTPFTKDGVNYGGLKTLLSKVVEAGYHGVFPTSSTGEVTKLTPEERVRVMEVAKEAAGGKALVVGGTGTGDHISTIEIARKYKEVGVDMLLITPPYYIQYDWAALYAFYKKVLNKVDMPTILYTIPLATGYNIPVEVFELVANEYSQVVGVKDSSGDFRYHLDLIHLLGRRLSVLQGLDMLFVPSLVMGAHGGVLAGPNFLGHITLEQYRLVKEGKDPGGRGHAQQVDAAVEVHGRLRASGQAGRQVAYPLQGRRPAGLRHRHGHAEGAPASHRRQG
jgi:dihydrodipicolinate synthase (EC 4.2.1.52)